jgi:hypothetical protein
VYDLVELTDLEIKLQKKPTKWDTATGVFQTDGSVLITNYCLPQFTRKKQLTSSFHMFHKRPKDKYDFILGHDLLKDIELDIHYSASPFMWDNITVDMVPNGYWTKTKIASITKSWNTNQKSASSDNDKAAEEVRITQILPADYKPMDIIDVIEKQTHLTPTEREKLQKVLFDFRDLFKGERGNYNGEPIKLELIPGSKPFYAKPFSIPKAYQQVTKD